MALYSLHLPHDIPSDAVQAAEKLRVVKDGFSWAAFIFPLPWLLINRLWLWSIVFIAASLLLAFAAMALGTSESVLFPSMLLLSLFIGLEAGRLKSEGLIKRGYSQVASLIARNREEAELKFFSSTETA
jgi:hypothetical protein